MINKMDCNEDISRMHKDFKNRHDIMPNACFLTILDCDYRYYSKCHGKNPQLVANEILE